mgnify:CR=1 FL=1
MVGARTGVVLFLEAKDDGDRSAANVELLNKVNKQVEIINNFLPLRTFNFTISFDHINQ